MTRTFDKFRLRAEPEQEVRAVSNLKKEMEARNQGMVYALKIAKDGGIEALEQEIKNRGITGISLSVSRKELEDASEKVKLHAMQFSVLVSLVTLYNEFKFSNFQGIKFTEEYWKVVSSIAEDNMTTAEYIASVKDKMGIEIELTE